MTEETNVVALPPPVRLTPDMIIRYYMSQMDRLEDILVFAIWKDTNRPMCSVSTEMGSAALAMAGAIALKLATKDAVEPIKKAPVKGPDSA